MNEKKITIGSLFSGSGGFELAGAMYGAVPVWASEIEPFPLLVTTKRFPDMKHMGDVSRVNGADLEPVDIVTGGSPCQDMSIAGKRNGLEGERSTLFHQQIRIVKEMREAHGKPRYMVWENVPGAFSSNKGEDFRTVLEEIARVKQPDAAIPEPERRKGGGLRWNTAGSIMGDGYSIAWRVFDAQYWGVPQRRKRIYLVADFDGTSAGKILFKPESLPWNFEKSAEAWQSLAGNPADCAGKTGGGGIAINHHPQDSRTELSKNGVCQTLTGKMGTGGGNVPLLLERTQISCLSVETHPADGRIQLNTDGKVQTLTAKMAKGGCDVPLVLDDQGGQQIAVNGEGIAPTLRAQVHGHPPITMQIRSGCEGGGKGALLQVEKSATLTGSQLQTLFEPIALDLYNQEVGEVMQTLRSGHGGDTVPCAAQPCLTPWDVQSRRIHSENGKWPSLYGGEGGGHGYVMTEAKEVMPINDKATRYKGGGETRNGDGAGNGLGIGEVDAPAYTLTAMDRHAVAYCLDKAAYNQGENALYGIGVTEDVAHTITAGWQPPAVAYDCRNDAVNLELSGTLQAKANGGQSLNYTNPVAVPEIAGTLMAKMAKGTGGPAGDECQNLVAWYPEYIVRRLMPVECGRLQGFPDGWTEGLAYAEPDEQTVDYWESVFEEHRRVTGEPKNRRKRSQIVKWLKNPYSDTALYKMWGNGIALPCAAFVMKGIVMELQGGGLQ